MTTKPITQFDRATCRAIGEELEAALTAVAAKWGLTAHYAGGTFAPTEFTARLKLTVTDPAAIEAKGRGELANYGSLYGLTEADYGKAFVTKGGTYRIIGLAPAKAKFPVVVERMSDGATMGFAVGVVALIRKGA